MTAKVYGRGNLYLGKVDGLPDGTVELVVTTGLLAAVLPNLSPPERLRQAAAQGLELGVRLLPRAGARDCFDPAEQ